MFLLSGKYCEGSIQNGAKDSSCTQVTMGGFCSFTCNSGYSKIVEKLACTSEHTWFPEQPCTGKV